MLFINWITCFQADIHAVVKEIANINNMDLLKIRNMMLEKWICKTGPAVTKVCHSKCTLILINESQFLFIYYYSA